MYYVETETPNHTIVTSYVTEKQARRYGGEPIKKDLILTNPGDGLVVYDKLNDDWLEEIYFDGPAGKVRTIFESHLDGAKSGKFLLYRFDGEGWIYTGIFFNSMSDANQAIKGPLSGTFSDMLVFELDAPVIADMTKAEAEERIRNNPPRLVSREEFSRTLSSQSSEFTKGVYDD